MNTAGAAGALARARGGSGGNPWPPALLLRRGAAEETCDLVAELAAVLAPDLPRCAINWMTTRCCSSSRERYASRSLESVSKGP